MTATLVSRAVEQQAAVRRPGQRVYRPELDALRFFAFLAVFLHHTLNVQAGGALMRHAWLRQTLPAVQESLGFGLCLFFFLSSYLITSLLELEKERTGGVDLRKFYVRRILRIWPLYFLFLGAMFVLGLWWEPAAIRPARVLALVLLAGNWAAMYGGMGSSVISHLWSISVEEQFYALWPSVSKAVPGRLLPLVCALICVACLGMTWLFAALGASSLSLWLNSLVQSLFFASGALLALVAGIQQHVKSLPRAALAIGAGLMLWLGTAFFSGIANHAQAPVAWRVTTGYGLVAIGCAQLLWGFLLLPTGLLPRFVIYLGRISYGLYVFHALALVATRALAPRLPGIFHMPGALLVTQLLITTVAATVSYEALEKPFLRLKSRFEVVHTQAA